MEYVNLKGARVPTLDTVGHSALMIDVMRQLVPAR